MRYLTFLFLFIPSICFADFSVAVNKLTGEVKGYCNGECGVQGWIDDGYAIVNDVKWETIKGMENDSLEWVDDGDGKIQGKEIKKKTALEIKMIKNNKANKEIRQQIIDLKIKSKEAQALQYSDIVDDIENKIQYLNSQL